MATNKRGDLMIHGKVPFTESYTIPLRGVTDNEVTLTGELRTVAAGETGDYATDFAVSDQHVGILINTIGAGGNIVITGTSINESTGIPTGSDTETITVDATAAQRYQTSKKWWEVTNIDVSALTTPDYDVEVIGYNDHNNLDFYITGYRCDAYAQGINPDFRLIIYKVQDDGAKKMTLVTIEDIGVDANGGADQIIDGLRIAGNDRSYNPAVGAIWGDNTMLTFKQDDFNSYFSSDENIIEGESKAEGYIIRIAGSPSGGISNVDYISLKIRYTEGA